MHQTQTSSFILFEVLHCSSQKIGNTAKTIYLNSFAGHFVIVPSSFTLLERVIESPSCRRWWYTPEHSGHCIGKTEMHMESKLTLLSAMINGANVDVIKRGGAIGPSHDRWLDKHPAAHPDLPFSSPLRV